jgi:hypothetical protein
MKLGALTAALAAITVATAVTGGVAYAAFPGKSSGTEDTARAGATAVREIFSQQIYGSARRKRAFARCNPGETAISGGYIVGGAPFQTYGSPAPKAIPIVTESHAASHEGRPFDTWMVVAVAPRDFDGKWALQARAMCG